MFKTKLHESTIQHPTHWAAVSFPAPKNEVLAPVRVHSMGQVAAHQLAEALTAAGYNPTKMQGWTPARTVLEPIVQSTLTPEWWAAYNACLVRIGLEPILSPNKDTPPRSITDYFLAWAKWDTCAQTVQLLQGPGIRMPWAIAACTKAYSNRRGPYESWADVFADFHGQVDKQPMTHNELAAAITDAPQSQLGKALAEEVDCAALDTDTLRRIAYKLGLGL